MDYTDRTGHSKLQEAMYTAKVLEGFPKVCQLAGASGDGFN